MRSLSILGFTPMRTQYDRYLRPRGPRTQYVARFSARRCASAHSGGADPAYVGLLGGLLFTDGKSDEAGKLFSESIRQEFSYDEKSRIQFRPRDPVDRSAPLRLSGRVTTVKPSDVFVQTDEYSDFISPTTKID